MIDVHRSVLVIPLILSRVSFLCHVCPLLLSLPVLRPWSLQPPQKSGPFAEESHNVFYYKKKKSLGASLFLRDRDARTGQNQTKKKLKAWTLGVWCNLTTASFSPLPCAHLLFRTYQSAEACSLRGCSTMRIFCSLASLRAWRACLQACQGTLFQENLALIWAWLTNPPTCGAPAKTVTMTYPHTPSKVI